MLGAITTLTIPLTVMNAVQLLLVHAHADDITSLGQFVQEITKNR